MNIYKIMIVSLLATMIIEVSIAYIMGIRAKRDLLNVLLVNILTNPLVVSISFMVYLRHGLMSKRIAMIFLELFAFISEGFIYKRVLDYKKHNGYMISFILNIISYTLGIIVNKVIW